MAGETLALHALADSLGIQRSYTDLDGRRHRASIDALLAVTKSLGAGIERIADAPDALRRLRDECGRRVVEPVVASFGTGAPRVPLKVVTPPLAMRVFVTSEGETNARQLPRVRVLARTADCVLVLPSLPPGYHRLRIELQGRTHETLLVRAPARAPRLAAGGTGLFLPLHALREDDDLGIGNFGGLSRLTEWCGGLGGSVVSTLPLLATNLDEPFEFSPYAPLSRCFWNEVFLDVRAVPELAMCGPARSALAAAAERAHALRAEPLVDYRAAVELVRTVLQPLAAQLATAEGARAASFSTFRQRVEVAAYASFRAVLATRGEPWQQWPEPQRSGRFATGSVDPVLADYHAYTQWLAEEQLTAVRTAADRAGVALYLDLPVGVQPAGFDTFLHQGLFLGGVAAGAPPDPLFSKGQNWGFPPAHPQRQREQGYRHLIDVLRHHMRHAHILRLDHVMGLHRLFCIPMGMDATAGLYVRYPADEMFAVVCLEASRAGCHVVGEDLGTVPPVIRARMHRHGLSRLHVQQFEIDPASTTPVRPAKPGSVGCLNTHDMATFAGFLGCRDLRDQHELGLLDDAALAAATGERQRVVAGLTSHLQQRGLVGTSPGPGDLLRGIHTLLAESECEMALISLEDLWLEPQPQNVPGTWRERPNWRRRAALSATQMFERPDLQALLRTLIRIRSQRSEEVATSR